MKARAAFWFGILALFAAAMPSTAVAQSEAPAAVVKPVPLPPDVAFGRFIALIRAHLGTGEELVARRNWKDAYPHFEFPREEIYGVIREDLRTYRTPPFDRALVDLARTVKSRNIKQYPKALQKVEAALAAADAGLKARQPDWPRFVLQVAIATVRTAPDEYEDAYAKGRIVRPIGYQTARGFIQQAERMIESLAGDFEGRNAEALREIRGRFAQLDEAFAAVDPPKQPLMDDASVLGIVAKIELVAAKLK